MRIAIWHNLPSGGGNRALYYQALGLLKRGHQLSIWSPEHADNRFVTALLQVQPVPVHTRPVAYSPQMNRHEQWRAFWFEDSANIRAMKEACRLWADELAREKPDIVLIHSCHHFAVPFLGRYLDLPTVLYLHEPNRFLYENQDGIGWSAPESISGNRLAPSNWRILWNDHCLTNFKRVMIREEIRNFKGYNRVLVNSYFTNESVIRAYGAAAEVCYLGIDTELFQDYALPRESLVIGLGTFMAHKNPELVIQALSRMGTLAPKLLWISNHTEPEFLQKMLRLASQLRVSLEVRTDISDQDLVNVLNRGCCLIYTSRLEPFGFAPLEANACGMPVVSVAEGGIRETIESGVNGLLVESNPDALAETLGRLLSDEPLWQHLSTGAVQHVREKWNWERSIDQLEAVLKETRRAGNTLHASLKTAFSP
ncbi:MAG: glycosyltransferase family 4 protein [Cytophagaceae bacterium]|nr:glycosyltransferase family 4 protein [Cytophagaceae bacterium]